MKFNKEYWKQNLKTELGLSHVPDEELDQHQVVYDIFNRDGADKISAKDYINNQLKSIEESYSTISDDWPDDIINSFEKPNENHDTIVRSTGEFVGPNLINTNIKLLEPVVQDIKRESIRYFDIDVEGMHYTVAVNANPNDFRTIDYINHIRGTSYFIEERPANFLTGLETIISYYQYVNIIQNKIRKSTDASTFDQISKNIDTVFQGIDDKLKDVANRFT